MLNLTDTSIIQANACAGTASLQTDVHPSPQTRNKPMQTRSSSLRFACDCSWKSPVKNHQYRNEQDRKLQSMPKQLQPITSECNCSRQDLAQHLFTMRWRTEHVHTSTLPAKKNLFVFHVFLHVVQLHSCPNEPGNYNRPRSLKLASMPRQCYS